MSREITLSRWLLVLIVVGLMVGCKTARTHEEPDSEVGESPQAGASALSPRLVLDLTTDSHDGGADDADLSVLIARVAEDLESERSAEAEWFSLEYSETPPHDVFPAGSWSQQDQEQTPPASGEDQTAELAKQSQNPVANLISVPIQSNFNFGVGHDDDLQYVLNLQPVIPFKVGNWNLINRPILPFIYQPSPVRGVDDEWGIGDLTYQLFVSPADAKSFIWGVGPVVVFPTTSVDTLGSGKFSAGPAFVGLLMKGPWVVGALATQIWSFAGDDDREGVSSLTVQPFINYNFGGGWFVTTSPVITANWKESGDDRWTVPLGGGFGRVFKIGSQPVNVSLQGFYNVVHPHGAAEWALRFQFTLLFPK